MSDQHFRENLGADVPSSYQRFFVPAIGMPVAMDLLQVSALQAGERVLDVGCGTGVVARLAAEAVGPTGSVHGLDVNPGMLAVAQSSTPKDMTITWHEASADAMPLPDAAFDVVLCQMSLQFMPDRVAALREMRRVMAPDGRLVLNVPGPITQLFDVVATAMSHHIEPEAAGFVRQVFALYETKELRQLLQDAGFRRVEVQENELRLPLREPEDFLWQYIRSTPLALVVAKADRKAHQAFEREVVDGWREFAAEDGLILEQRMVTATAVN